MSGTLNYDEFMNTGIDKVTKVTFLKVAQQLMDIMYMDEKVELVQDEEQPTVEITYRDSSNYKYPFALQLAADGYLWVAEPEWEEDEAEEQELFWNILREQFNVSPSFY